MILAGSRFFVQECRSAVPELPEIIIFTEAAAVVFIFSSCFSHSLCISRGYNGNSKDISGQKG